MNNNGNMVGIAKEKSVYFNPSTGQLKWLTNSLLHDINDQNQAVGMVSNGNKIEAILWTPEKGPVRLKTFLPANSKWSKLYTANQINNSGWITGSGMYDDNLEDFLMIPK